MIKRPTFWFVFLSVASGIVLFRVKYEVVTLENNLKQVRTDIAEHKEALHILKAEWAHLNEPMRLQELSQKYLSLQPIQSTQLVTFQDMSSDAEKPCDTDALDSYLERALSHENSPETGGRA
jgi:hypothetical protein